jgi:hypothetical protein
MTKEEIQSMFRLAALNAHTPECDPHKETLEMALANATRQYRDEVLDPANSKGGSETGPEWIPALQYLAGVFGKMDEDESEPDHEKMCEFRHKAWETIANGVQNWYQTSAAKKPAGEDHVFNPVD